MNDNWYLIKLQQVIDKKLRGLFEKKIQTSELNKVILKELLPEKITIKKAKIKKKKEETEEQQIGIPFLEGNLICSIIELIYKVQQIYFHEWDLEEDAGPPLKDVQLIKKVLTSSSKKLKIDASRYDPIVFIHVNYIWALIQDPQDILIQTCLTRLQHVFAL